MDEKLKVQYREVLEGYLLHNAEEELYKASMLSRELIKSRVGPDEIVATHFETLNEIMNGFYQDNARIAFDNASTVLLELMMSYAVAYREYTEMQKRLYQKERESNEFLELFISILSHDLKNPLFVIMSYDELIGDVCKNAGEYRDKIKIYAEKMQGLIEDAMTYSRVRATKLEFKLVDLADLIFGVVLELEEKAKENGITVKVDYDSKYEYTVNVTQFLRHAFINVLDNAIKYSPPGTVVEIGITDQSKEWKICIKDPGEGVSDESKQKIFDRFVRGVESGIKGSGIGLAIAKTAVMQNKGRIWVEDNPEGGAVFCIALSKWK
jgi:signal transduction histidine kinase